MTFSYRYLRASMTALWLLASATFALAQNDSLTPRLRKCETAFLVIG